MAGLPSGAVLGAAWLQSHGYNGALRRHYVNSGWLTSTHGAYRRPGPQPGWEAVLSSLQCLEGSPVVVGGRTALELAGLAHYLPQDSNTELKLWASGELPGWLRTALPDGVTFIARNPRRLFTGNAVPTRVEAPSADDTSKVQPLWSVQGEGIAHMPRGPDGWPLAVSSPERAVLELLHDVPADETFEQADDLFGSLNVLSPTRLRKLLPLCRHVRTLRLFAWFARRHRHPWLKHIRIEDLDLGTGKRQVVPGGELDPEFGITVPKGMGRKDADG